MLLHFWILIFLFHNLEKGENCLILSKGRWSTSMQYILLLLRRSEPLYSTFWIDIELEICNLKIIWYWRNLNQNPPKTIQFVKYKQALRAWANRDELNWFCELWIIFFQFHYFPFLIQIIKINRFTSLLFSAIPLRRTDPLSFPLFFV